MPLRSDRLWWLIPLTLLSAFLWQHWHWPAPWRHTMPDLITLVMFYWTLRKPHLIGSGWAFCIGLIRDCSEGTPLGQHALALIVTCHLVQVFYQRLRQFAVWQQTLVMGVLCGVYLLVCHWVYLLTLQGTEPVVQLQSALYSGLTWPLLYLFLRLLEQGRRFTAVRT